jgi:hypothetical protein
LFLGTEFGLYISVDGGANWARFENNLPKVAVHDMVIHPRDPSLSLSHAWPGCHPFRRHHAAAPIEYGSDESTAAFF